MKENINKVTTKLKKIEMVKVIKVSSFALIGAFCIMSVAEPHMFAATVPNPTDQMDKANSQMLNFAKHTKNVLNWGAIIGGVVCLFMMMAGEHISQGSRNKGKEGIGWIFLVLVLAQLIPGA